MKNFIQRLRYSKAALLALLLANILMGCNAPGAVQFPVAGPLVLTHPVADEISLEQLKRVLPTHPIVVGFDVDDTLLFSAPAFNALQPLFDPAVIRPKNYSLLTPGQRAQYHKFWNLLNEQYDDRSIPKKIGKQLLDLHLARGDDIYIISRRQATDPLSDASTRRIERMFGIHLKHAVITTNLADKTPWIARCKIEYYYGDSDSDITAAVAARATPIRVKRGADSYALDRPHNGELNELVLKDSEE